jgi:hypothetical protein
MIDIAKITDKVSHVGTFVRHGLTVVGGALMGFGIASQLDVDKLTNATDIIVKAAETIVSSASGIAGAVVAIAGVVASIKGNVKGVVGK